MRSPEVAREVERAAEAARAYAVAARLGDEAVGTASAIKLDAERKAGELLARMRDTGERDPGGRGPVESRPATQLVDLGVTKSQSSCWQALARMPEQEYAEVRERVKTRARGAESVPITQFVTQASGEKAIGATA